MYGRVTTGGYADIGKILPGLKPPAERALVHENGRFSPRHEDSFYTFVHTTDHL